jgi:sulfite reductase beta subunit-like hemoprotein
MPTTVEQHRAALAAHGNRLRRHLAGEIENDSWRPLRLSYGLYYQLDHTSHMQRIKVAGGMLSAAQLEVMADVTERYGRGIAHITTRQDIQIHWVPLEQIMDMYDRLLAVDITTRGACADTVRNVTACPYAGVSPDEPFDVAPYCLAIHDYFLFNPLNLTLPRKFKIAVEGCPLDCAQVPINDIGLYATLRGGERGFSLWAGGGLGSQPFLAVPVCDFVAAADVLIWCEAIVRVQHRHGERKNRSRARMKYVVKKMGPERFRATIEAEVARVTGERGAELRAEVAHWTGAYHVPPPAADVPAAAGGARPTFAAWKRTNVRPQRQAGYVSALVQLPLGDVTVDEMRRLAALVRRYGNGTLRATNDQNFVLPWIPEQALAAVHAELEDLTLGNPDVGTIADVVSCPGMDYCSLAITRSMGVAERVRDHLLADPATSDGFAAALGPFGIKVSGCPNSCGQHHVGDIGLTGHSVTDDDGVERPYYSILVGGSVGEGRGRIGRRVGRFAEERAPAAIVALARFYAGERQPGERFPEFLDRVGMEQATRVANEAAGTAS